MAEIQIFRGKRAAASRGAAGDGGSGCGVRLGPHAISGGFAGLRGGGGGPARTERRRKVDDTQDHCGTHASDGRTRAAQRERDFRQGELRDCAGGDRVVPQDRRIFADLTVRENLEVGRRGGREDGVDAGTDIRAVSCPAGAFDPSGRQPERWGTANARRRQDPDGKSEAPLAGRAVGGFGAHRREDIGRNTSFGSNRKAWRFCYPSRILLHAERMLTGPICWRRKTSGTKEANVRSRERSETSLSRCMMI